MTTLVFKLHLVFLSPTCAWTQAWFFAALKAPSSAQAKAVPTQQGDISHPDGYSPSLCIWSLRHRPLSPPVQAPCGYNNPRASSRKQKQKHEEICLITLTNKWGHLVYVFYIKWTSILSAWIPVQSIHLLL